MINIDELDELLFEKFHLTRSDLVAALKSMPTIRPWATALSEREAELLDGVGFTEDPIADSVADAASHIGLLLRSAISAARVAEALDVDMSRVRQRRLARTLWAINDGRAWVFPVMQFEVNPNTGHHRQIRGLDRVLANLPADLHPVVVADFLGSPHADLTFADRSLSPVEWLRTGGDIGVMLRLVEVVDWSSR